MARQYPFEDLPLDIQEDFRDAPRSWREKALRSEGWPENRIAEFLDKQNPTESVQTGG